MRVPISTHNGWDGETRWEVCGARKEGLRSPLWHQLSSPAKKQDPPSRHVVLADNEIAHFFG
jgi:hypothetical protein